MTQKEQLAKFIREKKHTHQEWLRFANTHSFIRLRSVGSNGDVQINLSSDSGWFDPKDWLANYTNSCTQAFERELARLKNIIPQDKITSILSQYEVTVKPSSNVELDYYQVKEWNQKEARDHFDFYSSGNAPTYGVFDIYRHIMSGLIGGVAEEELFNNAMTISRQAYGKPKFQG